jgi:hypothetical protein
MFLNLYKLMVQGASRFLRICLLYRLWRVKWPSSYPLSMSGALYNNKKLILRSKNCGAVEAALGVTLNDLKRAATENRRRSAIYQHTRPETQSLPQRMHSCFLFFWTIYRRPAYSSRDPIIITAYAMSDWFPKGQEPLAQQGYRMQQEQFSS